MKLDRIDRRILNELQLDGRLTNVQLAGRVGLSESASLRRVRMLEESGILQTYVALVNPDLVGLGGSVYIRVSLDRQKEEMLERFERAVLDVQEVMECYLMSGDVDYMMRVVVHDAKDYERIHNRLTRLPGVARIHSSFSLRTVLKRTRVPLRDTD